MMEWYQHKVIPSFLQASESSFRMSRRKGVDITSKSVSFESKRQKPSWCLLVMTMYFIPASFARRTQAAASKPPD